MADSEIFGDPKASLADRLAILYRTRDLGDCTFIVGVKREKIVAHKLFLALMSPVFYAMFFGDMPETVDIGIPDLTASSFTEMLKFVYTGSVDFISIQHAAEVLAAGKKYLMPVLEDICIEYIKKNVTVNNCIEIFELGKDMGYKSLQECGFDVIKRQTVDVIEGENFVEAQDYTIRMIVEQESLNINSELQLYNRVESWMIEESRRKAKELKDMFHNLSSIIEKIRFLVMSPKEFRSGPENSPLLTNEEKLAIYRRFSGITDDNSFPQRLSKNTSARAGCNGVVCGTIETKFSIPTIQGMNVGWHYSTEKCVVNNVDWKVGIEKMKLDNMFRYYFRICTTHANPPRIAKLRILDGNGKELEVFCLRSDIARQGWIDFVLENPISANGYMILRTCWLSENSLNVLKDTITVEVYVEI